MQDQKPSQSPSEQSCPTLDDLLRLIGEPQDSSSPLSQHVSGCVSCQDRLNQQTSSDLVQRSWYQPCKLDAESADRVLRRVFDTLDSPKLYPDQPSIQPGILNPATIPGSIGDLKQYNIVREIAAGGSATVFEGIDRINGQRVAIKFIRSRDPSMLKRAEREVRAVQKLNHPNVIPIHAIEMSDDQRLFLVMPLFNGKALSSWIESQGPMPVELAVHVIQQIAVALAAAHASGILHRDIKPSNIMIDEQNKAWLTDFGLASVVDDDTTLTESGTLMGTPAYMSPEQAKAGKSIDQRSDLYSLGATFYECLTGTRPFRGVPQKIIRDVIMVDPPRPRLLVEQIPAQIETICLKAMRKDAANRYQSVQEFIDDLNRWQKGLRILAKPTSSLQSLWQWAKREPRLSGTIAISVVTILLALMVSLYNWRRAEQRSLLAETRFDQARQAIDRLADVSENLVGNDPALESARLSILGSVEKFLADLVSERPTDPANLEKYYHTLNRLAKIRLIVSGPDTAILMRETAFSDSQNDLSQFPAHQGLRQVHCRLGIDLAGTLYEKGRQQESLDLLDKITIKLNSQNPRDHSLLAALHQAKGACYWAKFDFEHAKSELSQALTFGESIPSEDTSTASSNIIARANHTLGLCEMMLGNPEAAEKPLRKCVEHYEAACQKNPNSEPEFNSWFAGLINLERCYLQRRLSEEAIQVNRLISSKVGSHVANYPSHRIPQFVWLSLQTDAAISEIQQRHYREAVTELDRIQDEISKLAADYPQDYFVMRSQVFAGSAAAIAAIHLGQFEDAAKHLSQFSEKMQRIDKHSKNQVYQLEDAVLWNVLVALVYDMSGQYEQSLEYWNRTESLDPTRFSKAIQLLKAQTTLRSDKGQLTESSFGSADELQQALQDLEHMFIVTCVSSDWADELLTSSYQFAAMVAGAQPTGLSAEQAGNASQWKYRAANLLQNLRSRGYFEAPAHEKRLRLDPILGAISLPGSSKTPSDIQ